MPIGQNRRFPDRKQRGVESPKTVGGMKAVFYLTTLIIIWSLAGLFCAMNNEMGNFLIANAIAFIIMLLVPDGD